MITKRLDKQLRVVKTQKPNSIRVHKLRLQVKINLNMCALTAFFYIEGLFFKFYSCADHQSLSIRSIKT